jgi:peptidoglycan/xylan/chitin deacetylase (PgdA/CDA1 family)
MRTTFKNTAKKIFMLGAQAIPLSCYEKLVRKPVLAFCYHMVSDAPVRHVRHYPFKTTAEFESDIVYLKKHFAVLSYEHYRRLGTAGEACREPAALITFDDGFSECFSVVRPILLKHKVSAVFFVTSGFLDNKTMASEHVAALCLDALENQASADPLHKINAVTNGRFSSVPSVKTFLKGFSFEKVPVINAIASALSIDLARYASAKKPFLTSDQTKQLAAEGFTIGGHGVTHTRLDLLPELEARREIVESCKTVRELTGQEHVPFAFPHNGMNLDTHMFAWIKKEYPFIDLFFDAGWIWDESTFMRNRIWADLRWTAGRGGSNIPRILRAAYADYLRRKKQGIKR